MPEQVFLQNRNVVLEFPDGTPDDVIKKTIKREYPMTGEEVAGQMMVNPDWFLNDATLDEYERYREWKGEQADNMSFFGRATQTASDAAAAAADIIKNLGGAVKGTAKDPAGAALSLWDAGKIGTNDLVQVMQQVVHFETDDTYEEWLDGKEDTAANRTDWKHRLTDDFSREQDKIRYFSKTREKAIKDTSNPEAARGFAEVLDLSTFVGGFLAKPFAAAAAKASKKAVGDTAIALGSGMSRTGDTLAGIADRSAEALGQGFTKATGVTPETGKALAYSTGVGGTLASGAAMPLAAGYGAVRGLQLGGRVLAEAGEGVHRGIGREGFFGGAAARLEPGSGAQRLATGLSYADPLLEYGVRAAGGAAAGGAFGGALGALAEGWEGFGAGLGGGIALGGIGGGLYRGFEGLTGAALRDKRASDVKNYMDSLSGSDRSKFEQFIEMRGSRGTDEAANILDTASFIRGMLSDDTKEVRTIYVDDAESGLRGKVVSLTESDGVPTITINLAKAKDGYSANYTMGHELWHAMSKIEQLSPMAENIRREIAGLWVDGKVLEEGMLPAATFSKYFDDYVKKLPVDQQRAVAEKYVSPQSRAEYVADEIAAEHMAALVTGGTKGRKRYDTMLKAFDTPTQKALDAIILRNSGGVLGRMATRLSEAGFAPGKSFLFPDMGKASPVLNAMMRDMIRARKNLGERIVASDETFNGKKLHTAIRKQDFKHFQKELDDLGLLKSDGKGGKVMKDDKDIAIEEEASEQALRGILRSGSEGGMRIEVDESGNEVVRGNRFSPDQISAIQESATILPTTKRNVAAFNQAVESGSIMDMTYYAATRRTPNRLTGNYTSRYNSGIKRSRREVLPYSIEASKAGNIFVRAVDWTTLWNDTATMAMSGKLGAWDNNHQAFLRDFKEYLDNLSGLTPERSAARFGRDKADMMHDLLTAQKHGGGKYTKSFRLDRMDGLTPTGEKAMMSEQAYQLSKQRFMPDDGTVRAEPDQTFKQGVMRRHNGAEDARYMPSDGNDATRQVASEYMRRAGLRNLPHSGYLRPEESHLKELADWMQTADHRPNDPEVAASYEALKNEVIQQYETAVAAGLKAEPWEGAGEPYANSREMMADLKENGHMFFYRTENGFGESGMPVDHPMLEPVPFELNGRQLLLNDLFRIVHDYFGHTQQGFQFGPRGEYNAYKEHSAMFTEAAQGALAAETLAQNAWVNYGPHIRRKDGSVPAPQDRDYTHPSDRPFAEQKANVVPAEIRYMVDTPDVGRHITGVGDTAENLRQAITRRPATGVAKNQSIRFHDESDRPIVIGSDQLHGGKNFDLWIEENQKWLTTEEVSDYRKWYSELRGEFEKEFGKRDADKMMMSWLGAQQNASPLIGMQNVFRVEDRLDGITSGKKGGLADEKIEYILKRKVPPKGFGAKLSDFVDAGYLRKTRTYVGGDPRGGQPFVADVHTGRDSGHVDHTTLSRLIEKSKVGKLFVDGTPVKVEATKTKKVLTKDSKGNKKVKIVPEEAVVNFEDGRSIAISRDMTGSPSDTVYEGISVWGNQLTDYLNKANYEGGNWTPAEVQAVGWMRVLRQYDLPQNSISETWMANTHRVSAELNYMMGNVLPNVFPDFQSLPQKAQERITRDVTTRAVQDLAKIIGGSLRVRQLNVGLGYWQGQRSPAVQAFVMGSPEAGAIFRDALAYVSEQDTSFMVTFGKGGKGKQAVSFSRLDGGQLNQSDVNSFIDFVEKQGKADSRLIKGFSAYATPDNKGLLIAGLTDKSAPKVYDLIGRWADSSGLDIQAKKFSAVVEGSRNEWAKQKEGQGYLDGIVRRGGSERVRAIHDYRGRYFDLIEQAFKKHAPESLSQETSPSQLAQGRADFLKEPSRGNDPNARFMPDIGPAPQRADDGWIFPNGKFLSLGGLDHEGAFNSWANKNRNNSYANQVLGLKNDRVIKEDGHPDEPVRRKDVLKAGIVRVVREGDGVHRKIHAQGNMNRTQKAALERMAINSERSLSHDPSLEQHGEGLFYGRSSKLIYETPKKLRFNKERESMRQEMVDAGLIRFQPDIGGQDSLGMFSAAERATVDLKQERGSASQMLAMIKKAGVKDEEIAELGLDKFLEGNRKVSKDEIVDYLVENQITVEETVLEAGQGYVVTFDGQEVGRFKSYDRADTEVIRLVNEQLSDGDYHAGDWSDLYNRYETTGTDDTTKHSSYVEPGADEGSYRELLLRLPGRGVSFQKYVTDWEALTGQRFDEASPNKQEQIQQDYDAFVKEQTGKRAGNYTGGHYGEYPNVLAHVRFNDRTSEYGKTLFLEEMQSDWHQEGRKKGYSSDEARRAAEKAEQEFLDFDKKLRAKERTRAEINEAVLSQWNMFYDIGTIKDVKLALKWIKRGRLDVPGENLYRHTPEAILDEIKKINNQIPVRSDKDQAKLVDLEYKADEARRSVSQIPAAPFKTSWHELSMKRMISYAAKHGYDAIAWTKGETQANRYGTEEIAWVKTSPKTWEVKAVEQRGGEADGVNIEEAARAQGILKEGGTEVYGPGDLKRLIEETITSRQRSEFSPENYESHVDKMTNRIWGRMQSEDAGTSLPRKEGMEGFYDRMLPKMKTWKKLGLKVEEGGLGEDIKPYPVGEIATHIKDTHMVNPNDMGYRLESFDGRFSESVDYFYRLWKDRKKRETGEDFGPEDYHRYLVEVVHKDDPYLRFDEHNMGEEFQLSHTTGMIPAHIVKLTPEVKAKVLDTGIARFMPDASVPGAEKNSIGWSMILSKAGKWRVYDPSGALAGIAGSKAVAERIFRTKYKRELRRSSLAK